MNSHWITITQPEDLQGAIQDSYDKPIVFFKHSYRCFISTMAATQMRQLEDDPIGRYFIDVIAERTSSTALAQLSRVPHASPQVLLYSEGELVWSGSHGDIKAELIQALYREV